MIKRRKSVEKRKYYDSEDLGLDLTEGYPGIPPPTPEKGWLPYMPKYENPIDPPPQGCNPPFAESPIDIRRFDLLVGRIKYAKIHPNHPDTWMLTYVDAGFKYPLPIISSIGKFYDKQSLENKKIIALCNIEPVQDVANVGNTAMLMCAAAPDPDDPSSLVYELWEPPKKARVGDPLRCENYPLKADMVSPELPYMRNEENIFKDIIADVRVNSSRQVTYKNEKLWVRGLKGQYITVPTLYDCGVKNTFI